MRAMSEETFTYKAENGNICEIVDTFVETCHLIVTAHSVFGATSPFSML